MISCSSLCHQSSAIQTHGLRHSHLLVYTTVLYVTTMYTMTVRHSIVYANDDSCSNSRSSSVTSVSSNAQTANRSADMTQNTAIKHPQTPALDSPSPNNGTATTISHSVGQVISRDKIELPQPPLTLQKSQDLYCNSSALPPQAVNEKVINTVNSSSECVLCSAAIDNKQSDDTRRLQPPVHKALQHDLSNNTEASSNRTDTQPVQCDNTISTTAAAAIEVCRDGSITMTDTNVAATVNGVNDTGIADRQCTRHTSTHPHVPTAAIHSENIRHSMHHDAALITATALTATFTTAISPGRTDHICSIRQLQPSRSNSRATLITTAPGLAP
jgi:hypothetical protein